MKKKPIIIELTNYKLYQAKVNNINLEIERVKSEFQGIKGQSFEDNGGGGTNAITRSVENEVIKRQEKIDALIADKKFHEYMIKRIENALDPLTDIERKIIEEKYFEGNDFYYIADVIGYSYSWVKIAHRDAMNKLEISF